MCSNVAEGRRDAAPDRQDDRRCAYVIDDADSGRRVRFCDAIRQPGSAYCPDHHARCRLRGGSAAEKQRLREIEALAAAVGGKQGRTARQPSPGMLRHLERAARGAFARPNRSRNVLDRTDDKAADD